MTVHGIAVRSASTTRHKHPTHKDVTVISLSRTERAALGHIEELNSQLSARFDDRLQVQPSLTRQLVSFQANKERPGYRWFKFKEAFSASLIEHLIYGNAIRKGPVLDPFAGMGTTVFAASTLGIDAVGIELLPIGQEIIQTRLSLQHLSKRDVAVLRKWIRDKPWKHSRLSILIPTLRITMGAYPPETLDAIERYLGALQSEHERVGKLLRLALLCVLESVSYTRKDGQYLRWDYRAGRRNSTRPFNKGPIISFDEAITRKLHEIATDIDPSAVSLLFSEAGTRGSIHLFDGSCLHVFSNLMPSTYTAIVTSPPYCNRYDYTRTYALELALLGVGEQGLCHLRQQMLSCTVENRAKDLMAINSNWRRPVEVAEEQQALRAILTYLEQLREQGSLNNNGIPRMVRGYFFEMACVIAESARVLKPGGKLIMVNDNVRYAGASVPVDLILSDMAERLGFAVERILVLPTGKGNSSQQMGAHGRDQLRKCVYVWRRS
jgi:DNA modification methylase